MTFRIFVPGASALLTDHLPHGEGLLCWNLLAHLADRGHDIVAVTRRSEIRASAPFEVRTVAPIAGLGATGYALAAARVFHELGGHDRFDLAHWIRPGGVAVCWMPRSVPGVVGPLVPPWPDTDGETGPLAAAAARIQDAILRNRHRAVQRRCLVLRATDAAPPAVPGADTLVLPLGVDTRALAWTPMPPVFTVGFIGNLELRKGVLDLAEAFLLLVERGHPTARLLIAGTGPAEGELRRRLAGCDRVQFVGEYTRPQLGELLSRMSVVALPSRGEPFGMTVLEAMAAGRPVVVADAGSPPFLVGDDGGRVVPVGNPNALADALLHVGSLDATGLTRAGRQARARAEGFAIDRAIVRLEAAYGDVVARG